MSKISYYCGQRLFTDIPKKIVTTPTQPQLNSKVGCDMKMTNPPTPITHHRNSMSAISQLLLT